jgi:hypothetical protein
MESRIDEVNPKEANPKEINPKEVNLNNLYSVSSMKNLLSLLYYDKNIGEYLKAKKKVDYWTEDHLIKILPFFQGWIISRPVSQESINTIIKNLSHISLFQSILNLGITNAQVNGLVYHFGVIIGDEIIEFGSDTEDKTNAKIKRIPIREFLFGVSRSIDSIDSIEDTKYIPPSKRFKLIQRIDQLDLSVLKVHNLEEILNRAKKITEKPTEKTPEKITDKNNKYDVITNNCDHVAHQIACNQVFSIQSDIIQKYIEGISHKELTDFYQQNYYIIDCNPGDLSGQEILMKLIS